LRRGGRHYFSIFYSTSQKATVKEIQRIITRKPSSRPHLIFRGVPVKPDRRCWGQCDQVPQPSAVKLFSKYSNLYKNIPERHRQTDRRRTVASPRSAYSIAR